MNKKRRMNVRTEAFLAKRLSFLLTAALPVTESVRILAAQAPKREHASLDTVAHMLESGRTLSAAMEEHGGFSPFSISIIAIGESTGTLADNLSYLADELEKGSALRAKIIGALMYPALIALATSALTAGLILFIFPKILPVFEGLGVRLPWTTRTVLFISSYLTHWGIGTLAALLILGGLFAIALRRFPRLRAQTEMMLLFMPVIGTLVQSYYLSNITRVLAILLQSGMPLQKAITETATAVRHHIYASELLQLAENIERGTTLAFGMDTRGQLFPSMVTHMINVGERSGTLIKSLTYLAEYYGREVDEGTMRLTRLAEPALMVVMGCVVGFVAISMITPMYEITQHLDTH